MTDAQEPRPEIGPGPRPDVRWMGWAIQLHRAPWLFVQYGGTEADAWRHALGWPDDEEIAYAKAQGCRAFPVEIMESTR